MSFIKNMVQSIPKLNNVFLMKNMVQPRSINTQVEQGSANHAHPFRQMCLTLEGWWRRIGLNQEHPVISADDKDGSARAQNP